MVLPERIPIPEEVMAIARRLEEAGHEAWCVGGAVRDTLLGGEQKDFDLATSATPTGGPGAVQAHGGGRDQVRHGRRVRQRGSAARGHHLPA